MCIYIYEDIYTMYEVIYKFAYLHVCIYTLICINIFIYICIHIGKTFQKNQPNILLKKCLEAVIYLIKDGTSILDENKAKESEIRDLYVAGIYVYMCVYVCMSIYLYMHIL
jgi:hypothetical protein